MNAMDAYIQEAAPDRVIHKTTSSLSDDGFEALAGRAGRRGWTVAGVICITEHGYDSRLAEITAMPMEVDQLFFERRRSQRHRG
ncbi:hypothetical protein FEK33_17370 [Nocardia asteroides NBRC 15531]|uniref:Uncharacterized protein n=1 Tax=Nocardia asteroides NBRC 15531 TaxID=1110697 RepID=U5EDY1_NOCAS|nr:hypothetical protein [Nocardia asteroides]TLF67681.1 hypothetical protein FEK33_17370 [Nocardia asteroides NBRC 15531]UGT50757.1 hypothetical protein LT345_09535 [Nocardia asteroides]SFN82290.1 hypothetical protein SAMN05444423_11535 [Nocardia asteroides]VEG36402.1 Uncharacterised protein [Nocardia asteroides]GAD83409.1 hypothetical protein NCAST_19_01110 [Nocardia asteroides NBRC 15531]